MWGNLVCCHWMLGSLVHNIEEFNQQSASKKNEGFGSVERVVLPLNLLKLKVDSGDHTLTRVFWDRSKQNTHHPMLDHFTTLNSCLTRRLWSH